MRARALAMVGLLSVLPACAMQQYNADAINNQSEPTPSEANAVVHAMRETFFDPYSVRDAEISTVAKTVGIDGAYTKMLCVRSNAKNRLGAYTGRQSYIIYLTENNEFIRYNQDIFAVSYCSSKVRYRPFFEISQLNHL